MTFSIIHLVLLMYTKLGLDQCLWLSMPGIMGQLSKNLQYTPHKLKVISIKGQVHSQVHK